MDGAYSIKAAGIFQQDPGYFTDRDGVGSPTAQTFPRRRANRRPVRHQRQMGLGLDRHPGDRHQFLYDYRLGQFTSAFDPFQTGVAAEGVSQLYLTGTGDRSYFDIRSIYYYGFSESDVQAQIPVIHPVLDYIQRAGAAGDGRRAQLQVQPHQPEPAASRVRSPSTRAPRPTAPAQTNTADPAVLMPVELPAARHSGRLQPRLRRDRLAPHAVTNNGQEITPFVGLRGDVATLTVDNQPGVANYIATGTASWRASCRRPASSTAIPSSTCSRGARRPSSRSRRSLCDRTRPASANSRTKTRKAWSSTTAICFKIDKFSGWDRVEGGGRANVGFQYTAQFNHAGSFNMLFGQSYQLFGENSFRRVSDITNTGLDSGLDKTVSDYVAASPFSRTRSIRSPRAPVSTRHTFTSSAWNSKAAPLSIGGRCS